MPVFSGKCCLGLTGDFITICSWHWQQWQAWQWKLFRRFRSQEINQSRLLHWNLQFSAVQGGECVCELVESIKKKKITSFQTEGSTFSWPLFSLFHSFIFLKNKGKYSVLNFLSRSLASSPHFRRCGCHDNRWVILIFNLCMQRGPPPSRPALAHGCDTLICSG